MQMIKETMDKKFGAPWHVVAGGYFSYDITFEVRSALESRQAEHASVAFCCFVHQVTCSSCIACLQCKNLLYIYLGGTTGVLLWKM